MTAGTDVMEKEKKVYISVILPLKLEWTPYYGIPSGETVMPGEWVQVDFAGRSYTGIVLETGVMPDTAPEKIKDISSADRSARPVTAEEIRLWKMVADYYLCTLGEVFKAAYPLLKISQQAALARMRERDRVRTERMREQLEARIRKAEASLAIRQEKLEKYRNILVGTAKKENILSEKENILSEKENILSKKEKECARLEELIRKTVDEISLAKTKLECLGTAPSLPGDCGSGTMSYAGDSISLTEAQEKVFNGVLESFCAGKPALIKGVTGSGKTEIYLKLAAKALSEGKNVLYLVPEIAVTRQLQERIRKIFGDRLLTYHSEETAAARRNTAEKVRCSGESGRQYIVLGTRSAIFLPHRRLGLVIVDEEHESSYKQDSPAPRYNGRDVAVMLSSIHRCGTVLGSATPSLESVFNAMCGKYGMLVLDSRYYKAEAARVEIIDTTEERKKRGMCGSFSRKLAARMEDTMRTGGQVLLLRARRAFSPVLQCPECGDIPKCPHCNVSLSLHKNPDRLVCHHCGYSAPFDPLCRKCGATLQGLGSGTQKIEEETRALFPSARIARLDGDTSRTAAAETIERFNAGETDILIGTQIVAKGFDFPRLELSAIISADSLLGMQDFRADEKAMQILEQLRGRCGRRERQGLFIIQTGRPDHPVYRQLAEGGSDILYPALLTERKEFGYPPFTRLVNIDIRDTDERRAERMSSGLAARLKGIFPENDGQDMLYEAVSMPFRPPVDKVADNFIRTVRVTLKKDRYLHGYKKSVASVIASFEKDNRYAGHITIDVDPE